MKRFLIRILLILPVLFVGCDQEEEEELLERNSSCARLAEALVANESDKVGTEIDRMIRVYQTYFAHNEEVLLNKVVEQINACPTLEVVEICFQCIETNPPQSEITISITANEETVIRIIDLIYRENRLMYAGMHE